MEVEGNTKYINVNFKSEDEPYRFVFDTGAESFVIGYLLFEELKSKGLVFEDMGIRKTTRGVIRDRSSTPKEKASLYREAFLVYHYIPKFIQKFY